MPKMCCNAYNKKVLIQELTATADAHGFVDDTADVSWTTYCTSYATVISKGGREFWKNDQKLADVNHIWTCPWTKTLEAAKPSMRLKYETATYSIILVENIDLSNKTVVIHTAKKVA